MKKSLLFSFLLFYSTITFSQVINPDDIVGVCSDQNIISSTPTGTNYNNLRTHCSSSPLTNTLVLYNIEITSGTTFAFTVSPLANVDYDFASWLNPNLNNLGPADRGSQNDPNQTSTFAVGLSLNEPTETCELPGAGNSGLIPGMVRYYDVQPGDIILIAINRWSTTDSGFVISFGGNASLNCSLFDKDFDLCDTDHNGMETFDLDQIANEIRNGTSTDIIDFFANENDAKNSAATNTLPASHIAYTANNPNLIYARIKRANGVMKKVMTIKLFANKVPIIEQQQLDLEMCDYNKDGQEVFNLKSLETSIANGQTDLEFKYYENLIDAEDNTTNNITAPQNYISTPKTVYIRVSINDKCPIIINLNLIINDTPIIAQPIIKYPLCDKDNDGTVIFDLSSREAEITNGQTDLSFKYYEHQADADQDNNNFISTPRSYSSTEKDIYVRVSLHEKCAVTVVLKLLVNKTPQIANTKIDYEICDDNLDGKEIFDLTSYESIIAQNQTDLEFSYYEILQAAQEGTANVISTDLKNYSSKQKTVYIRVSIDGKCPVIISLNLIPAKTKISPSESLISEICGEVTPDALTYDLTRALPTLLQGENAADYKISYYSVEDEARNSRNSLQNFSNYLLNYNFQKVIYVRFENEKGCYTISTIVLDSKKRITDEDQYMPECEPYKLPVLPLGYHYYTQANGPRGKGVLIDTTNPENALVFGQRTIYIYASSKSKDQIQDQQNPDLDECIYQINFKVYNNDCKVPKGISPNGDAKNDFWNLTPFGVSRLSIHNRYGKEVYKFSGNYSNEWHGQSTKGEPLPHGTYWYSMDALNGQREGWIQLIR